MDQAPDVVILDIKMPGIDGHETLIKIKKNKSQITSDHAHRPWCHALGQRKPWKKVPLIILANPVISIFWPKKIKEACRLQDKNLGSPRSAVWWIS